jgi:endogenous inhibitor of DNA gyrase (YacG/DUF329 family)
MDEKVPCAECGKPVLVKLAGKRNAFELPRQAMTGS